MHTRQSFREETHLRGREKRGVMTGWMDLETGRVENKRGAFLSLMLRRKKSNQPSVIQSGMERCTFVSVCVQRAWCILLSYHTSHFLSHTEEVKKLLLRGHPEQLTLLCSLGSLPLVDWLWCGGSRSRASEQFPAIIPEAKWLPARPDSRLILHVS